MKTIYKITYPNGRIYIGMNFANGIDHFGFGKAKSRAAAADFTPEQLRTFTVTREVLWESETAEDWEVKEKETEFIVALKANDPQIGYNRSPKFKPDMMYRSTIKTDFGLTDKEIDAMGPPDKIVNNPHYSCAGKAKLYRMDRVLKYATSIGK